MLGSVVVYSTGTFFAQHHLTGTDTPYVDMPYHLALIGELRHHVPSSIPYVSGVPLAYHWFFYAEAAATSWATGIEPVALLYRLSGLPFFAGFVVLTAHAARRLTGGWWTGPVAVAVALFGVVAAPYRWAGAPVFDTQTLGTTWISPTHLFGLVLFAAVILVLIDLLTPARRTGRGQWLLLALLVAGIAGAKASLVPMLVVGLVVVIGGVAISRRQLLRPAVAALLMAGIALVLAAIVLFRGTTGGLVIGLESLRSLPVVALAGGGHAGGIRSVVLVVGGLVAALVLWSFLWAGAYGLLVRRTGSTVDPRILLLLGICASALGAVIVFSYPGPKPGVLPARCCRRVRVADGSRHRGDPPLSRSRCPANHSRRDHGDRGRRSGPDHPRGRPTGGADPGRRRSPRRSGHDPRADPDTGRRRGRELRLDHPTRRETLRVARGHRNPPRGADDRVQPPERGRAPRITGHAAARVWRDDPGRGDRGVTLAA